jgi:hypothetical protein
MSIILQDERNDYDKNYRYSIAAKRILEKLQPLKSQIELAKRRWFWELTQNACDARMAPDTEVEVYLTNKELIYKHNGKPFNYLEAHNLIEPDSDKDDQDKLGNKDQIGQYGTGFISTHILSSLITISGVMSRKNGDKCWFKYTLDRGKKVNEDHKVSLMNSISNALNELDNNCWVPGKGYQPGIDTSFTYHLDQPFESEDGLEMAKAGIKSLGSDLPFVFAFYHNLKSVTIYENIKKTSQSVYVGKQVQTGPYSLYKTTRYGDIGQSLIEKETFIAVFTQSYTSIAVELKIEGDGSKRVMPFSQNLCRLHCAYPMIGTETFEFPIPINNERFVPRNDRDGIELSPNDTENRGIIVEAVVLYQKLLMTADQENWLDIYNLCRIENSNHRDSSIKQWFNEQISNKLRQAILTNRTVETNFERRILKNSLIPYADNEKDLATICKLFSQIANNIMPIQNHSMEWFKILDFSYFKEQAFKVSNLVAWVHQYKNLPELQQKLKKEAKATSWLYKLIELVLKTSDKAIPDNYAIIPAKSGNLNRKAALSWDDGVPEELKKIWDDYTGSAYDDKLLHEKFESLQQLLPKENKLGLADIAKSLDDKLRDNRGTDGSRKYQIAINGILIWIRKSYADEPDTINIKKLFPWIVENKAQLVLDSFENEEDRESAFTIVQSGKIKALEKIAKSKLTDVEIGMIGDNIQAFKQFLQLTNNFVDDRKFADSDVGEMGESIIYRYLVERFGEEKIKWSSKGGEVRYDFEVLGPDDDAIYYIDAKTTVTGIENADSVPFFVRTSQWEFLSEPANQNKYYIARIFKKTDKFDIRFIQINNSGITL